MDRTAPYVSSRLKLTAKIGDVEFNDIVSFSSTFGLNTIPIATLAVATGREMNSGKLATIHEAKKTLKAGDEAVVTLEVIGGGGDTEKMEAGVYTIFRGRYAGIGYKRSYNTAGYVLHLIHWLDDLNRGSMLNGHWMPGAPFDMAQNAGFYALTQTDGDAVTSGMPVIDVKNEYIVPSNISADFWDLVLREVFARICDWPAPHWQLGEPEKEKAAREPVKAALERMSPRGPGKDWYKPLGLNLDGMNNMSIAAAIKTGVTKDSIDSFAYTTFWNKLVGEYASQFFFAISPSVDFALPVPFFAGVNTPHKLIFANDYNYADFNASVLQQLEAVEIFYSIQNYAGGNIGELRPGNPFPSFKVPLGFYPPPDKRTRRGYKMLKEPPTWMTNTFFGPAFVWGSTSDPRDCCSAEQVNNEPLDGYSLSNDTIIQLQNGAASRFAEHWYKTEVLYQRHGEMSGKLRFDIAPGSIVAIETPPRDNEEQDILFATATQVSFAIDAERAAAGTSFTLAHIRTSEENDDDLLTSEKPPMYASVWRGAPLAVRQ